MDITPILAFMPHGHCYLWNSTLIWLHLISDGLITLAYYSIPFTLIYFVKKRKDLVFNWMFILFAVFIIACGTTHLMEIWTIWHSNYWLSGMIKLFTALASVPTAILLIGLVPKAMKIPSVESLAEKNKELETKNKELESFSYSVSHDLRAPLRHINSFAKLLKEKEMESMDDESKKFLGLIEKSSEQMSHLIDDLLNYSRIARKELEKTDINLDKLISDTVEFKKTLHPDRNIEWTVQTGLPTIKGDYPLLKDALIILLSNAIKYSRPRNPAKIQIGCFKNDNKEVVIFVKDNGVGFDMRYYNKLFGVFQRLHSAEEFEGTGIGLANLKRIINRHNGKVWGEGKVNEGATFYFSLPK